MMNAFVARFALSIIGSRGALFDLTGCMWRSEPALEDGRHRQITSSDGPGSRHPTAFEAGAGVLSAFEQAAEGDPLAVFLPMSLTRRGVIAERLIAGLAQWDLTHVIDTSGCYIPGHGMPTMLLIGRSQPPVFSTVRVVVGLRGEPRTPDDPEHGVAWSSILRHVDQPGRGDEFARCADVPREALGLAPWELDGLVSA